MIEAAPNHDQFGLWCCPSCLEVERGSSPWLERQGYAQKEVILMSVLCPKCRVGMKTKVYEESEDGTFEILECEVCGYAEWNFEGDQWSMGGTAVPLSQSGSSAGATRRGGSAGRAKAS